MKMSINRRWIVLFLLLPMVMLSAGPTFAGKKKPAASKEKAADKEKPKWDVAKPPGIWKSVTIDTTETTWSNLDVSPDGATIVFDMLGDLYVVPIEGGEAKPLTTGIPWNFQPRYSPDGRQIAFISDRAGGDNLWVMNADGSDPRAITEEKEHIVHNPYWSPDGLYILGKKGFTSTRSIPAGEIWMFHIGGGGGVQLVERRDGKTAQKNIAEPSFSPDGRYVYYSRDSTPGRVWQYNKDSTGQIFTIQRLDLTTGETDTVAGGAGGAIRPIPSPDGKLLAFVRRTPDFTSALYVKDLHSGEERAVYGLLDRDLQEADGSMGNTPAFAWTPDGRSLVFWAGGKIRRVDIATTESKIIPVHVRAEKKIAPALRFPVKVAPEKLQVRMLRWAQYSPDGKTALFQALGHLYRKDLAGGRQERLIGKENEFEFYPVYSPDGKSIAYTTWNDDTLGTVRLASADFSGSRTLVDEPGHYIEPRFSPDGRLLVYRKITGGYLLDGNWSMDPGIYLVSTEPNAGPPKRISKTGFNPQFDADGKRVFFSTVEEETQLVLKSVNLNGKDERTHLKGKMALEYQVSPDGRWVAFIERYNAYIAPFPRTSKTVTLGLEGKAFPVRKVSSRSGEFLHWAPDSSALRWSHGATLYNRKLKDTFAFLDGAPEKLPEPVAKGVNLSFQVDADIPDGILALTHGRIVTMRNADQQQEVIPDGTVVVVGNRILSVGPSDSTAIPAGAEVIDLAGKTVLPGLVDVHAHGAMANNEITPQQNWMQMANLAFGVTTIHDPSNDSSEIFSAAEMQRAGMITAPHIFSTGTILYGAHAPGYRAEIDSLEDAEFHVRRLKELGAISVKSYQQPRRDQRQQVIAAARKLGIMVVPEGGAKFQTNMSEISDGHTGIEHAIPIVSGYDDVRQFWSSSGTGYTPTFVVAYGGISGENFFYDRTNVWEDKRLMAFTPRFIVEPRSMRRTKAPDIHYNHIHVAEFAKTLRDSGVGVNIGAHGQRAGLAAHWELWSMVQGGFSPWEAYRGGTIDGAKYLGMDGDIGSLEKGKLADLMVVDGDVLSDIRQSENLVYTLIGGRLYDSNTMNQLFPDKVERKPFFFQKEGGDTIHPLTMKYFQEFKEKHGWVH